MDFTEIFIVQSERDALLEEALHIIKRNADGPIWIIGGFVFRTIVNVFYKKSIPVPDIDFVIEKPTKDLSLPSGWEVEKNIFGNLKFIKNSTEIDFIPLDNIAPLRRLNLSPSIYNWLRHAPLTVQSIAYDVYRKKVIGDIGIKAILDQTVAVNDLDEARIYCNLKKISLNDFIREKAEALGFTPIYY